MADLTNIFNFNNADGLPPDVIKKLNNNFYFMAQKIRKPEITAVAGTMFPTPRTEETLFYKTDTGDLYIWAKFGNDEWGWFAITAARPGYVQNYEELDNKPEIGGVELVGNVSVEDLGLKSWTNTQAFINTAIANIFTNYTVQDWLNLPNFRAAVQYIINQQTP